MNNTNQSIKIIVLILSSADLPWSKIEKEGQRATFARENTVSTSFYWIRGSEKIKHKLRVRLLAWLLDRWYSFVLFFNKLGLKGPKSFPFARQMSTYLNSLEPINLSRSKIQIQNSVMSIPLPEHKSLIGLKTLLAMDFVSKNFTFDYLMRTNSSSFIDVVGMENFLVDQPRNKFVAGFQGDFFGESFTSGAGYIISKDVVDQLVSHNFNNWEHHVIDDVAFSRVIQRELKIQPNHIERVTLTDLNDEFFETNSDPEVFHYRCKTNNPETSISLMKKINNKISKQTHETT